jgi:uncharacterized protein YqeY
MELTARLEQDYIVAYKAKDAPRLSALRLVKTALKHFQVEHLRPPSDDDVLEVLMRQCKQRRDSIEQFSAAGRRELADKEEAELRALLAYLPVPLAGAELEAAVAGAVRELGAAGMKDMGRVMQALSSAYTSRFDAKAAGEAVKAALRAPA